MRIRTLSSALVLAALGLVAPAPGHALSPSVTTFATGLNVVRGLAHDGSGNLYAILRYPTRQIVRFALPGNTPTLVASTGMVDPIEGVFGDDGNLYVTDYNNAAAGGWIKKVTPGGTVTNFVAVSNPGPITRDAAGNLYVGEYFNERILKVTPAGVVSVYVASAGAGTRLTMLYMDTDGVLYAGMLTGEIYRIGPGGSPTTMFSTGLGSVVGFAKSLTGHWFASTYDLHTIRSIPAAGGPSTLYAGSTTGFLDGPPLSAKFSFPAGMLALGGTLYIADLNNDRIRQIDYATSALPTSWGRLKRLYH